MLAERYLAIYEQKPFDPSQVKSGVLWRTKALRRQIEGKTRLPAYPMVASNVPDLGRDYCLSCAAALNPREDEREVKVHEPVTCQDCRAALRRILEKWSAERWGQSKKA